jgi:hypothetical protein
MFSNRRPKITQLKVGPKYYLYYVEESLLGGFMSGKLGKLRSRCEVKNVVPAKLRHRTSSMRRTSTRSRVESSLKQ